MASPKPRPRRARNCTINGSVAPMAAVGSSISSIENVAFAASPMTPAPPPPDSQAPDSQW